MHLKTKILFFIKITLAISIFFPVVIVSAPKVSAASFLTGNNLCTPDNTSGGSAHNISRCINNLYIIAVSLAGFGAVFMLIYAGYLYMTGGSETVQTAKSIFSSTIVALAILFSAYA